MRSADRQYFICLLLSSPNQLYSSCDPVPLFNNTPCPLARTYNTYIKISLSSETSSLLSPVFTSPHLISSHLKPSINPTLSTYFSHLTHSPIHIHTTMSKPDLEPKRTLAGITVDPKTLERVIPESRRADGSYVSFSYFLSFYVCGFMAYSYSL